METKNRKTNFFLSVDDKAVSQPTNRQIESVNRERESVAALVFFGFHYRISLSTITFEFLAANISTALPIQPERDREIEIIL
jgi:hypothetical protein